MGKYENLAGFQCGLWTILGNGRVVNKNRKVPAMCKCGTQKEVYLQTILRGQSTSCGCFSSKQARERLINKPIPVTLKDGIAARNSLLSQYKGIARKRNYQWDLTQDEFFSLTKGNCFYCGNEPSYVKKTQYKTGTYTYNGIDRKNNNLGYSSENSVSCCGICNVAKNTMGLEEFKKWVLKVNNRINNVNINT